MKISALYLRDFRNFEELNLNLADTINIFLGRNAQGKTNILEAVNFSALGTARVAKDSELVRWTNDAALIRINFSKLDVSHVLALEIPAHSGRRKILLDGNSIKLRDCIGKLNAVMFSPEDLFIFRNSPASRRKFLNITLAQTAPIYFSELATYNRLIEQRNNLLKKIREGTAAPNSLEIWNEQLAAAAAKVTAKRITAVENLNILANEMQKKISAQSENLLLVYEIHDLKNVYAPQNFNCDYLQSWYYKIFSSRNFIDIARGSTSFGPHLDDLNFFINGKELRLYGSQGQLRTTALALKLSEIAMIKSAAGEYPVLLLDDVMSELDASRREKLLDFLLTQKIQTLITATERAYFPAQICGKIFQVENGAVHFEEEIS
ncbi:MAG: DNA replication/repair protein RecF [Selenomonadaceae bacterium]|nr:DNA replication/repair protein RecF [Selenomonadaceae bacterium]